MDIPDYYCETILYTDSKFKVQFNRFPIIPQYSTCKIVKLLECPKKTLPILT